MELQRFEYVTYYNNYQDNELHGPDYSILASNINDADEKVMLLLKNWLSVNKIKYSAYGANCTNYHP